jgi:hypothetical protein
VSRGIIPSRVLFFLFCFRRDVYFVGRILVTCVQPPMCVCVD